MIRSAFLLTSALALAACSEAMPDPDAGPDSGSDAGRDAGPPPVDAGRRDAGSTACTTGCNWVELALGSDHTCARRENGEVWCWGRNQEGQLGDNRTQHESCGGTGGPTDCSGTAVQVRVNNTDTFPAIEDAVEITAQGARSTCARRESGELWCWGPEGVAPGMEMPDYRFTAVRVEDFGEITQASNGHHHTCMVRGATGQLICFGYGSSGDLGTGSKTDIYEPTTANAVVDPADVTMDFLGALQVEASGYTGTTCARTIDRVYCWGDNESGQLGDGLATGHDAMQCVSGLNSYDCSSVPVMVGESGTPLTDVTDIQVGFGHVCALSTTGTLSCWGDNRFGQITRPMAEGLVSPPVTVDTGGTIAQVDAGAAHTCVRHSDGTLWCWGFNNYGQLGDGVDILGGGTHGEVCSAEGQNGDCSRMPVQVMGIDDATVIGVGASHSCAVRETNEIWCWGYNDNRQLGDGTRDTRVAPVRVLGLPE